METYSPENSLKPNVTLPKINVKTLLIVISFFILSTISSFFGGYYFNKILNQQTTENITATPTPSRTPVDAKIIDETVTQPGLEYYDDTIIAFSKDDPKNILVASVTRQENNDYVNQNTRVSYFNGTDWVRKVLSNKNQTVSIYPNEIITEWRITIDPSRVLRQTVSGNLNIENVNLKFNTGVIDNNIGIRSLPGYTKFMSNGIGSLTINGQESQAYILYTRIYSNNSKEMQFYDTALGITTHWLAFWDNDGNFYHLDSTDVDQPTQKYETHQIGVMVDKTGGVSKTFQVTVKASNENPPARYQINLGDPINKNISFDIGKTLNKAPNNAYNWFMSEGKGQAGDAVGFGIIEYIRN